MLLIALGIAVVSTLFFLLGVFGNYQHRVADALYGGKPVPNNIVIIGIDDKSLQEIGRWPWERGNFSLLAQKLNESDLVGIDVAFLEHSSNDAPLKKLGKNVVGVSEYTDFSVANGMVTGEGLLKPVPEVTVPTGYANIVTDQDGVARSINLDLGDEQAFSAELYKQFVGASYEKKQRFNINFVGPPGSFVRYSATDVLSGRVPSSTFKGKIVLVGAVASDFHDDVIVPTSAGQPMPGVEVHANALATMIVGNELQTVPKWLTIFTIFLVTFLVTFFILRFSVPIAGALSFGLGVLYIALAFFLFSNNYLPNAFYVPFTILFAFIVLVAIELIQERILKRKVADAFGKYVSPNLLAKIMEKEVELGGERKQLTILFSDIRGFTSISEKLTPEGLVDFLNSYFTRVTRIIMDEEGLVDKFIGDAIMAFWNAPLDVKDHADHAVAAALAMKATLEVIRREHAGKYPALDVGIGLNTGEAIVGNIGSNERLSYTAIGDSVNLASRLEGLTKEYGVHIIISENTKRALKKKVVLRELDRVKVKGKKEPVTIHELIGVATKKEIATIKKYEKGLHHYYKGEWSEAIDIFTTLEDKASHLLEGRCRAFLEEPPVEWTGAYEMTHK